RRRRHTRFSRDWSSDVCSSDLTLAASAPALGQEARRSVRTGYAHVLRVEPVYQTLTATRMEQHCDGKLVKDAADEDDGTPSEPRSEERRVGKENRSRVKQRQQN